MGNIPPWLRSADIVSPDAGSIDREEELCLRRKKAPGALLRENLEQKYKQYHELIMAVATKVPGETRHQTALRYILEAEQRRHAGKDTKQTKTM